ncbi:hypothetical protein LJC33_00475 [Eubacteriales bacterium OttesenSCG-928-N13]|nr:hypothetical protein [Eubacteriales bacterium OttesenSCG-928-N13]
MSNEKLGNAVLEPMGPTVSEQEIGELARPAEPFDNLPGTEMVEMREACIKHFSLGNGRHQMIAYPEPVHYEENGEWKEIDNTLEEVEAQDGRRVLRNRAGALKAEFAEEGGNGALVSLTNNGNTLNWSFERPARHARVHVRQGTDMKREYLLDRAKASRRRNKADLESATLEELEAKYQSAQEWRSQPAKNRAETRYDGLMPGVSVRYELEGGHLKEDIILENREAVQYAVLKLPKKYSYKLKADQRVLVQDKASGETLFTFAAPVSFDALGSAMDTKVDLESRPGYVRMRYVLDETQLETAVFPVTIDPYVETGREDSNMTVCMLKKGALQRSIGGYIKSGVKNKTEWITLMKIKNLGNFKLKSSDTVTQAGLWMVEHSSSDKNYMSVHEVLVPWSAGSVSWATVDYTDEKKVAPIPLDCRKSQKGDNVFTMDVTRAFRHWLMTKAEDPETDDTGKPQEDEEDTGVKNRTQNFGIMLRKPDGINGNNYCEVRAPGTPDQWKRPVFFVNYMSHAGIQGWWQYESRSAGRAGTANVDLFNGNMVFEHTDMATSGNRMPVSVAHYYNSCMSTEAKIGEKDSDDPKKSNNFHCGTGFKLNVQQCIREEKLSKRNSKDPTFELKEYTYYVWTDESGTEHWFPKKAAGKTSKDLEGMKLKLVYHKGTTKKPHYITITSEDHTVMRFQRRTDLKHASWVNRWLVSVTDATGKNKASYSYVEPTGKIDDAGNVQELEGMVEKITDGTGREINLLYNDERLLTEINWPAPEGETERRKIQYSYDEEKRLTGIGYYDLQAQGAEEYVANTTYEYDDGLLIRAQNYDGARLQIGFEDVKRFDVCPTCHQRFRNTSASRAISLESSKVSAGENAVLGAKQLFRYEELVTEVMAVDSLTEDTGKTLTYQFNMNGNVVSVRDELGFAQFTKFSANIENQPTEISKLQKVVTNRLKSFSFVKPSKKNSKGKKVGASEDESLWTENLWELGTGASVGEEGAPKLCGFKSMSMLGVAAGETVAKQTVTLEPGDYTLSAYIKPDTGATAANTKAFLRIKLLDKGDVQSGENLDIDAILWDEEEDNGKADLDLSGWGRTSLGFNVPALTGAATRVQVELVNAGAKKVWFGWPQLEEGKIANHVNQITNSDFRLSYTDAKSQIAPKYWERAANAKSHGSVEDAHSDFPKSLAGRCMKLASTRARGKVSLYQEIAIAGKKNDVFTLGGWAKAISLPGKNAKAPYFDIAMQFKDKEGKFSKTIYCTFNKAQREWQFACRAVIAPFVYKAVRVQINYSQNMMEAQFSNLYLYREEFGRSFAYDKDKNITSTSNLSGQKSGIKRDEAKNIIQYKQPGKPGAQTYDFSYGKTEAAQKKHLMQWSRTPEKLVTEYEYDEYGNQKETLLRHSGETAGKGSGGIYIKATTQYDETGNYAIGSKDARGNTTTKVIDPNTGRLKSVTAANGQTVEYDYDDADRLTQTKATVGDKTYKNNYTYDQYGKMTGVSHNTDAGDVSYSFEYDNLDAQTSVRVGDRLLSTNVYDETKRGHLLKHSVFGNDGAIHMDHDDFDRVTWIKYDDDTEPRYEYKYDAEGRSSLMFDNRLNRKQWSEYDLSGRPMRSTLTDKTGEQLIYRSRLAYDKFNRLTGFKETAYGETNESFYGYDKDNRTKAVRFGEKDAKRRIDYTFDSLGRISKRTLTNGKTGSTLNAQSTSYTFVKGDQPVIYNKTETNAKSTTTLVEQIRHEKMGANGADMLLGYVYDNVGNITGFTTSDKLGNVISNVKQTQYTYDLLGQLIRVDDPHEDASWVYEYDCGGNIKRKSKYALSAGELVGEPQTINYTYTNAWKDLLTSYDGKPIAYDVIGNPRAYDGWTYEWKAGRKLMKMKKRGGSGQGADFLDDTDEASGTTLSIHFSGDNVLSDENSNLLASAHVNKKGVDDTQNIPDSAFTWTRDSGDAAADAKWAAQHAGVKQVELTAADIGLNGKVVIRCTLEGAAKVYGEIKTDMNKMSLERKPGNADAQHEFVLVDGVLSVDIPDAPLEESGDDGWDDGDLPPEGAGEPDPEEEIPEGDPDDEEPDDEDPEEETEPGPEEPTDEDGEPIDDGEPDDGDGDDDPDNPDVKDDLDDDDMSEDKEEPEPEPADEDDDLPDEDAEPVAIYEEYLLDSGNLNLNTSLCENRPMTAMVTVYDHAADNMLEYAYDAAGLRIQKKHTVQTEDGEKVTTTDYILHGKLVIHQRTTVTLDEVPQGDPVDLHFWYDAASKPAMVKYGGAYYSYLHNLQGDVIAMVDAGGVKVVEYGYDAWGRILGTTGSMAETLGWLNPFRYRGYVYDEETGLYYLRTRYYDPEWGRFLNEDSLVGETGKLLSHNMFGYCSNNPVARQDIHGTSWQDAVRDKWNGFTQTAKMGYQVAKDETRKAIDKGIAWTVNTAWPAIQSTADKTGRSAGAVMHNIKGKAAFGVGLGAGAKVGGVGAELSANLDAIQLRTSPKIASNGSLPAGIELGWEAGVAVQLGIPLFSASAAIGSSTTSAGNLEYEQVGDETTLASLSLYCVIGGTLELKLDNKGLLQEWEAIWCNP